MGRTVTSEEMTVYRGESVERDLIINSLPIGWSYFPDAYHSTSTNRNTGRGFSKSVPRKAWKIIIPKGTHAIAIGGSESELLISRSGRYVKVDKDTLRWEDSQ